MAQYSYLLTYMKGRSVIIIGAGAAGLMAAKQLSAFAQVTVLEAKDRPGGRIHTFNMESDIIEAGAEFIHGVMPLTMDLLKNAGVTYSKVTGAMYRKRNGALVKNKRRSLMAGTYCLKI